MALVITTMASYSEFEGIGVAGVLGLRGDAVMVRSTSIQHRCDWRLGSRIVRGNKVLHIRTTIGLLLRDKGGVGEGEDIDMCINKQEHTQNRLG